MKNFHIERKLRLAKQYHKYERRDQFINGILAHHQYDHISPNSLSWWDDVEFILGGRRICVTWQHPRQIFCDKISDLAVTAARHLIRDGIESGLEHYDKVYKKLGRSRKKIQAYEMSFDNNDSYYDAINVEKSRLGEEVDFVIIPSIKVDILNWCRFVDIVAPIDIHNTDDLKKLATLVRQILTRKTTLDREFKNYKYTRDQWINEGLGGKPNHALIHRVV